MCSTEVNFFPKYSVVHRKKKTENIDVDKKENNSFGEIDSDIEQKIICESRDICKIQNGNENKKVDDFDKKVSKIVRSKLSLLSTVSSISNYPLDKRKKSFEGEKGYINETTAVKSSFFYHSGQSNTSGSSKSDLTQLGPKKGSETAKEQKFHDKLSSPVSELWPILNEKVPANFSFSATTDEANIHGSSNSVIEIDRKYSFRSIKDKCSKLINIRSPNTRL